MSLADNLANKSTIPLRGSMVAALMSAFSLKPVQGDDTWPICSIGVAHNSVVATDNASAIMVGDEAAEHEATDYKETLLECHRSNLYGSPVDLDELQRNVNEAGEVQMMPNIVGAIHRDLSAMETVAKLDPRALARIVKAAIAAGAVSIELLQPKAIGEKRLGFKFVVPPAEEHMNLFSTWTGMIPVSGVVTTDEGRSAARIHQEEATLEEDSVPIVEKKRGRKKKDEVAATAESPNAPPTLTVVESVDIAAVASRGGVDLPPLSILGDYPMEVGTGEHADSIVKVLANFGITCRVEKVDAGPCVSLYEVAIPQTTSVKRVVALQDDLQAQLGVSSIRIQAPIPGKKTVGIELPNANPQTVGLRSVLARKEFLDAPPLTFGVGLDVAGTPIYADLAKMPHLLVAGATNSGKSIGVASLIASLLIRNTPKELRMVLIDPKRVELTLFADIPHLMCPVVTDMKDAPGVLRAIWREMDIRYETLQVAGSRNIENYNADKAWEDKLPNIVVVIDELADLMIQAKAEVETSIVRLTQMARAVGIHLVIATQRPSVDVVTGLIKANVPSRIGFACASGIDSKVILDQTGAEKLLGRGDMLFSPIGTPPRRVQGAYVSEAEVAQIVGWWKKQGRPTFDFSITSGPVDDLPPVLGERHKDFEAAVRWVAERGQASTSMLQRRFSIGFQAASKILDQMEALQVVGPRDGPRPREVLVKLADVEKYLQDIGDEQ